MSRITVDEAFLRQVQAAAGPVEMVDAGGHIIGTFRPRPADEPTAAELEAIVRNCKRWYTTAEVLAHVRSLG